MLGQLVSGRHAVDKDIQVQRKAPKTNLGKKYYQKDTSRNRNAGTQWPLGIKAGLDRHVVSLRAEELVTRIKTSTEFKQRNNEAEVYVADRWKEKPKESGQIFCTEP